nr:reverse transcriptase domain-containing protein [Tanacetum cinerariifolium]
MMKLQQRDAQTQGVDWVNSTTYLRNEITNFLQKPNETFNEAYERFKDLLRQCPHHGFSELHQLDTFYNSLNPNDQDALDSVAGGNFLDKIPRECLSIIESKSKVRYSRSRVTDVRANANAPPLSSSHSNFFDLQQIAASLEDKLDIRMNRFEKNINDMKNSFITPTAPLKVVEEELIENDIKRMDADDQAIQTILLGLPEDVYAVVDSCETAKDIWERVQQMMKGSDIREQEKKAKLFNEWEKFTFTSNEGESIESYYHRFLKLMNDLKRNKHFPEKIASNLKFLNNLQLEWSRYVTIVHQTKDLHKADYTQLYDFLKYNQKEVDELKAE